MNGTVRAVNSINGFAAIQTDADEYSIVELLGGELEPGDEVRGELEGLGGASLVNVRTGERLSVFIQDCHASPERAVQLLRAR